MKSRLKKKNVNHEGETPVKNSELVMRSLSHLNRSIRQFSDGLQTRALTLQDRLVIEPLESAAWAVSQRVRKVQTRVFDFIDAKISLLEETRHRKIDHQTALERFDGEGGAMQPTTTTETVEERVPRSARTPFEPTLQS
jgi:hypothetical protein